MSLKRRLILAIDPGTELLGYCVYMPGEPRARKLGAVHLKGRLHFRLGWIHEAVTKLLEEQAGQDLDCVVEKAIVWGGNNATIALAEARGVILACIAIAKGRLYEYHASQIKKAITGNGAAKKWDVAQMMRQLLQVEEEGLPFDAYDAAGLAYYHGNRAKIYRDAND